MAKTMKQVESSLTVVKANDLQKRQVFLNVHEEWPHHPDPLEHLRLRLASVTHLRATWFVGLCEEKPITSLGAYPLMLRIGGLNVPAIGIGAVHTHRAFRSRGFAGILLREVLRMAQLEGCGYALLYSDIGTAYYEKFGFSKLNSLTFDLCLDHAVDDETSVQDLRFLGLDTHDVLSILVNLYTAQFTDQTIGVERNRDHFAWLLQRESDLRLSLILRAEAPLGYILYKWDNHQLVIRDYAFLPALCGSLSLTTLFRSWVRADPELQRATVLRGWYHNIKYTYDQLALSERDREIIMLARLDQSGSSVPWQHQLFSWIDHF